MKTIPSKETFADYICRPYCIFYKEGVKDDMSCGGAIVVLQLIDAGRWTPGRDSIPPVHTRNDNPDLESLVCRRCPFVLDGCDFRSPSPPSDAAPCGGFILLSRLIDAGTITLEDIREVRRP
jgi:hypothetical protein